MIPPGIGMVLYGSIGEVSIGRMFAAGFVPGILMTIFLMIAVGFTARMKGYQPERKQRASLKEIGRTFVESIWAFLFPVILIVALRFGLFTPSEAGAFACAYAIIVGMLAYREFTWKKLITALESTVVDIGMVMLMIALSSTFSYGIIWEHLPEKLAAFMVSISTRALGRHAHHRALPPARRDLHGLDGADPDADVHPDPGRAEAGHRPRALRHRHGADAHPRPAHPARRARCSTSSARSSSAASRDFMRESWVFQLTVVLVVVLVIFWPGLVLWMPNLIFGKG